MPVPAAGKELGDEAVVCVAGLVSNVDSVAWVIELSSNDVVGCSNKVVVSTNGAVDDGGGLATDSLAEVVGLAIGGDASGDVEDADDAAVVGWPLVAAAVGSLSMMALSAAVQPSP